MEDDRVDVEVDWNEENSVFEARCAAWPEFFAIGDTWELAALRLIDMIEEAVNGKASVDSN